MMMFKNHYRTPANNRLHIMMRMSVICEFDDEDTIMVWGPRLSTLSVPRVVLNYTAKYDRKVRYLIEAGSYDSNSVYRYHFHPFANMHTA